VKINKNFAEIINKIRNDNLENRSHTREVVHWVEEHRLRSGAAKALVFILPTKGCSWALSNSGGCSICGYIYDNPQHTDFEKIIKTIRGALKGKIEKEEKYSVKLFTSGSFLDNKEVPTEFQIAILEEIKIYDQIEEIVIESRPEYISSKSLEILSKIIDINKLEIAIGLESSNNEILRNSINKGFYWEDFKKAVKTSINAGARVKAYLLFKPPFISEYNSVEDILRSISKVVEIGVDTVSINAISIHRGTYLSNLYEKNQYRPPWLWSLFYLCKEIKMQFPKLRVICDIVAGGTERGAHNCGSCDKDLLNILKEFTLTQNIDTLKQDVQCSCQNEWKSFLIHEKISISDL